MRENSAGRPTWRETEPAEPALLTNRVARALPRPLGVAVGAAMLLHWDIGVLSMVGFGLLLSSVPRHPAARWRYVRTVLVVQPSTDWKYLQEGTRRVDLVTREEATFELVRAIREVTGSESTPQWNWSSRAVGWGDGQVVRAFPLSGK